MPNPYPAPRKTTGKDAPSSWYRMVAALTTSAGSIVHEVTLGAIRNGEVDPNETWRGVPLLAVCFTARAGDRLAVACARALLQAGADPAARADALALPARRNGFNARACSFGEGDMLWLPDGWAASPLAAAFDMGCADGVKMLLPSLAERGPALADLRGGRGLPWLHEAVARSDEGLVRVLLDGGADIRQRDASGATALFHARSADMVKLLLERGAEPVAGDARGRGADWAWRSEAGAIGQTEVRRMEARRFGKAPRTARGGIERLLDGSASLAGAARLLPAAGPSAREWLFWGALRNLHAASLNETATKSEVKASFVEAATGHGSEAPWSEEDRHAAILLRLAIAAPAAWSSLSPGGLDWSNTITGETFSRKREAMLAGWPDEALPSPDFILHPGPALHGLRVDGERMVAACERMEAALEGETFMAEYTFLARHRSALPYRLAPCAQGGAAAGAALVWLAQRHPREFPEAVALLLVAQAKGKVDFASLAGVSPQAAGLLAGAVSVAWSQGLIAFGRNAAPVSGIESQSYSMVAAETLGGKALGGALARAMMDGGLDAAAAQAVFHAGFEEGARLCCGIGEVRAPVASGEAWTRAMRKSWLAPVASAFDMLDQRDRFALAPGAAVKSRHRRV